MSGPPSEMGVRPIDCQYYSHDEETDNSLSHEQRRGNPDVGNASSSQAHTQVERKQNLSYLAIPNLII